MKYKVEGCVVPEQSPDQVMIVTPFSKWYQADTHLDAASMFLLEYPEVNCATILVVDEDYSLGSYPLDAVKVNADYQCGLRC